MKGNYKIIAGILTALGVLAIAVEGITRSSGEKIEEAITVIGGADGPTSIYVAGKVGNTEYLYLAGVVLLGAAAAILILSRKKK